MDKFMLVRVLLILVAGVILFVLIRNYSSKHNMVTSEKFFGDMKKTADDAADANAVQPSEGLNSDFKSVSFADEKPQGDCFPKDRLTAEDLLPKDAANSTWAAVNPAGQGDVKDQNFLQAGFHVGLNTTQGTLRNGNMQIRSEVANPQMVVSPWMNSTLSPDMQRRPLEIGNECN
jgi:hypothetical protein